MLCNKMKIVFVCSCPELVQKLDGIKMYYLTLFIVSF